LTLRQLIHPPYTAALEKRQPMMEAWEFCVPAKAAKVIPFTAG